METTRAMSESEFLVYVGIFTVIIVGLIIYADRQRMKVEQLRRQVRREREKLSRYLHPTRHD